MQKAYQDRPFSGLSPIKLKLSRKLIGLFLCIYFYYVLCCRFDARGEGPAERHDAVLEISSATTQNTGLYTCRARNTAGTAEKRIQIIVDTYPVRGDITGENNCCCCLFLALYIAVVTVSYKNNVGNILSVLYILFYLFLFSTNDVYSLV